MAADTMEAELAGSASIICLEASDRDADELVVALTELIGELGGESAVEALGASVRLVRVRLPEGVRQRFDSALALAGAAVLAPEPERLVLVAGAPRPPASNQAERAAPDPRRPKKRPFNLGAQDEAIMGSGLHDRGSCRVCCHRS